MCYRILMKLVHNIIYYCPIEVPHKIMFGNRSQSVYVCIMHACARAVYVGKFVNKRAIYVYHITMCMIMEQSGLEVGA